MIEKSKKYLLFFTVIFLMFFCIFVFYVDFNKNQNYLKFAVLNIGQGDAIFIESPTGVQMLFDAGPYGKINSQIHKVLPFYDKSIDAIFITHPDIDHIGGFKYILENFKINYAFEAGTTSDSILYENLTKEIKNQKIPKVLLHKGMKIHIGGGAYIEIIFPDQDVSFWDTNDGSLVARLSYGQTSLMLTGDATKLTERIVLNENDARLLKSSILKVGHHGSYTSTSPEFVQAVSPNYAVISDGKNNKYGHPHQETLDILTSFGTKVFRTDLLGTIVMKSDGKNINFSFFK